MQVLDNYSRLCFMINIIVTIVASAICIQVSNDYEKTTLCFYRILSVFMKTFNSLDDGFRQYNQCRLDMLQLAKNPGIS